MTSSIETIRLHAVEVSEWDGVCVVSGAVLRSRHGDTTGLTHIGDISNVFDKG